MRYHEYIQSEEWKQTRQRYIKSSYRKSRVKCKLCACFGPIDLHHLTYARVGQEYKSDLLGLCRECHDLIHSLMKVDAKSQPKLPGVIKKARKKWFAHANMFGLWNLRKADPRRYKELATEFMRAFLFRRFSMLNKQTNGRAIGWNSRNVNLAKFGH